MRFSATKLVGLRHARSRSRDSLAHGVGCSRDALSLWERGRTAPKAVHLAALARELDVPIEELFEPEEVLA